MFTNILGRLSYFIKDFSLYIILVPVIFAVIVYASYKIFKSDLDLIRKKILTASLFSIFMLVITITVFEGYFRYIYDVPDGLGYLKVNKRWHERHVVFNNYFFRDRDFETEKETGVTRIGALGDSITFGGGIEKNQDRFSNLLEEKLRKSGKNVEVYNLGKSGYDTEAEVKEYEKVKHLNFDIIVWEYFLNDIQPQGKSTGTPIIEQNSKKGKIVTFLSDRSVFFDFIYWRFSQRYQKTFQALRTADLDQYKNQQVLSDHKKTIADFMEELKKENKKVVVIIFPSTILLNNKNYPAKDVHEMMASHFQHYGATTIDLLPDLINRNGKELMTSRFDPHPNEEVHQLAAQKLFDQLNAYLEKE